MFGGRSRRAMLVALLLAVLLPAAPAAADPAGAVTRTIQAGWLDGGDYSICARLASRDVRCWGYGVDGQLGQASTGNIGSPGVLAESVPPVRVGGGRTASQVTRGYDQSCALLDDGAVRCWGNGAFGALGLGTIQVIGNDEFPDVVATVDLGVGHTARALTAGTDFTCALMDDRSVRCWGRGADGRLGTGSTATIGDDETAAAGAPVALGPGRTATAIAAGQQHACAILDTGQVRCWGYGSSGALGLGSTASVGDDELPSALPPVDLGPGRRAVAISAGNSFTCVILDSGQVRCWGDNYYGQLGLGNTANLGDNELPVTAPPVDLGSGRTAVAIAAGYDHVCAILDTGQVRCWGSPDKGALGYGNLTPIGDTESPASAGPVDLGAGRTAVALAAGWQYSCAALDNGDVRCWGNNDEFELGLGRAKLQYLGDDELPSTAGPIPLGGRFAAQIADLSLTGAIAPATVPAGSPATLTLTIVNGGVDTASAVAVTITAPEASLGAGNADRGSLAGGTWSVGDLAPGASATLTVPVNRASAGTTTVAAEVTASGTNDPDSTPGNGAPGEDDRVAAQLTATPAPATARPASTIRLTVNARLKVTRRSGRRIVLSGRLVGTSACSGTVRITVTARGRRLARTTAKLRRSRSACRYAATLRAPKPTRNRRSVVVTVSRGGAQSARATVGLS